jgi:release factor glutamine methyltransferase
VPTDFKEREQAQIDKGIAGAWAGGADGMEVTNLFLDQVAVSFSYVIHEALHDRDTQRLSLCRQDMLAPTGSAYLVTVRQNDPQGIIAKMSDSRGLLGNVRVIPFPR